MTLHRRAFIICRCIVMASRILDEGEVNAFSPQLSRSIKSALNFDAFHFRSSARLDALTRVLPDTPLDFQQHPSLTLPLPTQTSPNCFAILPEPCQDTPYTFETTADDTGRRAARESAPYIHHGEFPNGDKYCNFEEPFPGGRFAYTVTSKANSAWITIEDYRIYRRPGIVKLANRCGRRFG